MADIILYVLKGFVSVILTLIQLAMLIRAILSWFVDPLNEGGISTFLAILTEPLIAPVRALCAKMHWFEGVPIDVPFIITWLLLSLLQTVIQMV